MKSAIQLYQEYVEVQKNTLDIFGCYDHAKISFASRGLRSAKIMLGKLAKKGNDVALALSIATTAELFSIRAKKAWRYGDDRPKYYKKKAKQIAKLIKLAQKNGWTYGTHQSDSTRTSHIIYFEIPGCEQLSYHYTPSKDIILPIYEKEWDQKRNSTIKKLSVAVERLLPKPRKVIENRIIYGYSEEPMSVQNAKIKKLWEDYRFQEDTEEKQRRNESTTAERYIKHLFPEHSVDEIISMVSHTVISDDKVIQNCWEAAYIRLVHRVINWLSTRAHKHCIESYKKERITYKDSYHNEFSGPDIFVAYNFHDILRHVKKLEGRWDSHLHKASNDLAPIATVFPDIAEKIKERVAAMWDMVAKLPPEKLASLMKRETPSHHSISGAINF